MMMGWGQMGSDDGIIFGDGLRTCQNMSKAYNNHSIFGGMVTSIDIHKHPRFEGTQGPRVLT